MKTLTGLLAMISSIFSGYSAKSETPLPINPTSLPALSKASPANELAWKLYRAIGTKQGNVFISPASITTAVGLAFEGSSGATRAKAIKFLALDSGNEKKPLVPSSYASFKNPGTSIELQMHNAIWSDPEGIMPTAEFIRHAENAYSAKIESRAFGDGVKLSEELNAWVKKATKGLIDKIVAPANLNGKHLAVLNAVYFLGTWQNPFDAEHTQEENFSKENGQKVPLPLMNEMKRFAYADYGSYKLIHLPYKNPDYVMSIILPKAGTKLSELEKTLSAQAFETPVKTQDVWVKLPKMTIDWGVENVIHPLITLGMPSSGPKEDFKSLGAQEPLVISAVLHRAVIKVDEKGTEAAAVTAVIMVEGAVAAPKPEEFHCDHPFLFAIRDAKRNEILFMGRFTGLSAP